MVDLIIAQPAATDPSAARRYLLIALVPILCLAASMFAFGVWLGPAEGDLTRIGGFSEHEFGWRTPDEALLSGHEVERATLGALVGGKSAGDIIVFGDSFSAERGGRLSWLDLVQHRTGLSVLVVRSSSYRDVIEYLTSPSFRTKPPRAVIIETVERAQMIIGQDVYEAAAACERAAAPLGIAGRPGAGPLATQPAMRRTAYQSLDELYARASVAIQAHMRGNDKVIAVGLTRSDLFSSTRPDRLIIYFEDVGRHATAPLPLGAAAKEMTCGLRRLATLAGDVPLWLVTAPDKRTIYAPWIADPLPEKVVDVFAIARDALGPAYIDVRWTLLEAANAGVRDLYLPNDTHWGARGHRLVGDAVANALLTGTD